MSDLEQLKQAVEQKASQCVKCGLCLPHCPTYAITENESESPRGRIALLKGLATHQVPLTANLQLYLDHCLTCRACERACPAKVEYGALIDQGREMLARFNLKKPFLFRSLYFIVQHPALLRLMRQLLRYYQGSGLQFLMRRTKLLKKSKLARFDAILPKLTSSFTVWKAYYPAVGQERGRVALFTGCVSNTFDQATLSAAIKVITACGYSVYIPKTQRCCGALFLHAGDIDKAQWLTQHNVKAFDLEQIEAVITVASGCGLALKEAGFKTVDISQFIMQTWLSQLILKPLKKSVFLHTPCTLRHDTNSIKHVYALIKKIPEITITSSSGSNCCGGAGTYFLEHPAMADKLLETTLKRIHQLQPDYVVTSNIGCALHFQGQLLQANHKIKVLHPVALLAQQCRQ